MLKASILGYKFGSVGTVNLSNAFGEIDVDAMRLRQDSARYRRIRSGEAARDQHMLIVWGSVPEERGFAPAANRLILNAGNKEVYTNKRMFFETFYGHQNLRLPNYSTNLGAAQDWMASLYRDTSETTRQSRPLLVERQRLSDHSGAGILLLYGRSADDIQLPTPAGRLWTKYIPKAKEFRVHFFRGVDEFIVQEKRLRTGFNNGTNDQQGNSIFKVRNHQNGWVYCRENVNPPRDVIAQALAFKNCTRNTLDFGAIDIIYNENEERAFILEVNTAPGIEGQTATDYARMFKRMAELHNWQTPNFTAVA